MSMGQKKQSVGEAFNCQVTLKLTNLRVGKGGLLPLNLAGTQIGINCRNPDIQESGCSNLSGSKHPFLTCRLLSLSYNLEA